MSSGNAELVHRMLGAYVSGDEETLRSMIGPDSEIYGAPGLINSGVYRGFDGFQQWIEQWEDAWGEVSYELGEATEMGDGFVVIPAHIVARGAGSGVETDNVFGWMWEFRDGRAVRFHAYVTVDEAKNAAERLAEAE
jgi:ketosteroid isomerase-like protein